MTSDTNTSKLRSASNSNDVYWISTICKSRAVIYPSKSIFSLTISFVNFQESDLQNGFYLIVVDKIGYDGEIVVDEYLQSAGVRQRLRHKSNNAHNTRLFRRLLSSSQTLERGRNEGFATKPPMVVLECRFNRGPFAELMFYPFQPNHSDELDNPKILFDRVYPLEHGEHTLTTLLEFQSGRRERLTDYDLRPAGPTYLSIIRDHKFRPSAPSLPKHVISSICAYTLHEYTPFMPDWCNALFSLGVINSSWAFIFNVRWELLGSGSTKAKEFHQFGSATAAIKRGLLPEVTNNFIGFNIDMFSYQPEDQDQFIEFATTFIGTSNHFLHLHINAEILLMAADALVAQERVLTFKISMKYEPFLLSLSEVLKVIQSWTQLTHLTFRLDWQWPDCALNWNLEPADSGTTSFQLLEELSFYEGYLPGNQFIQFLPAAPGRLRRLFICRVAGLSTRVISTFLALTHSTLAELHILESGVQRTITDSTGTSYDYPLDAWVDKMKCLTHVSVPATVASIQSLSRKSRVSPEHQSQNSSTRDFTSVFSIDCEYVSPDDVHNCDHWESSLYADLLASAINQTCWDKVYISLPFQSPPSNDVWGKAIEAAERRGMVLEVNGAVSSLRSKVFK